MKNILPVLSLILLVSFSIPDTCHTTIVVQDCKKKPVEGAKVTIGLCGGGNKTIRTNESGEAKFDYCQDAICKVDIVARINGGPVKAGGAPKNCNGGNTNSRCIYVLCEEV